MAYLADQISSPPSPTVVDPVTASSNDNLWESILKSVSTRRSIPSGNVLILGEPSSGKSTIANALLRRGASGSKTGLGGGGAGRGPDPPSGLGLGGQWVGKNDFALGYQWTNVKEEGEEDVVARLSVYNVPSSDPSHLALIPGFLPPKSTLSQTLVLIVLDWTKPWTFVDQLRTWLSWVERWVESDKNREAQVMKEEGRERLQSHLQHYIEPSTSSTLTEPVATVSSSMNSTLLPLGPGTLTHNIAGVPIIVTCAKADLIDEEENVGLGTAKGKGSEWEEKTDGIMQILRTICLKYGAALFYTTPQSQTLSVLRQYVLHFLFAPPPPAPDSPPLKYIFPFAHRPNTLDRDRVLVPAGWDSWGKISVLRDGFDAEKWGEAWERDLDHEGLSGTNIVVTGGANEAYRSLIGEALQSRNAAAAGGKDASLPALITTEDEQTFLGRHFETLSKDPTRDPRAQFRQPIASGSDGYGSGGSGAGVLGPMGGSSSLSLPSVEKAMAEMENEDVGARISRATAGAMPPRRPETRPSGQNSLSSLNIPSLGASNPASALRTSPIPPSPAPNSADRKQHDVLSDFFQKLLTNRSAGASSPTLGASPTTTTNGAPTPRRPHPHPQADSGSSS